MVNKLNGLQQYLMLQQCYLTMVSTKAQTVPISEQCGLKEKKNSKGKRIMEHSTHLRWLDPKTVGELPFRCLGFRSGPNLYRLEIYSIYQRLELLPV